MNKRLTTDSVQNELESASAFFPGFRKAEPGFQRPPRVDTSSTPMPAPLPPTKKPDARATEAPPARPNGRTPVRRQTSRYAFEFYQDQVATLKQWALEEQLAGEKSSMSEMVRQAVDEYIARRKQADDKPDDQPADRTGVR